MTLYVCPHCNNLVSPDETDSLTLIYCFHCGKSFKRINDNLYKKEDYDKKMNSERPETELKDSEVWINKSKSGKGFTIKVGDDFYVGSVESLQKFINGEVKGVNLSISVPKG